MAEHQTKKHPILREISKAADKAIAPGMISVQILYDPVEQESLFFEVLGSSDYRQIALILKSIMVVCMNKANRA